jgi:hypothetical protein
MLADHQEEMPHPFRLDGLRLLQGFLHGEGLAGGLRVVPPEPAVEAVVQAVVGEVQGGEEADAQSEAAPARVPGHLDEGLRRGGLRRSDLQRIQCRLHILTCGGW